MTGLLIPLALVAAVAAWLLTRRRTGEPLEPADRDLLEAAEREVRELGSGQRPEDGWEGDDWGPGAPKG